MLVGLVKGKLESEGVSVILKNDLSSGGAGELAPIDLWPEIWLLKEVDKQKAEKVLAAFNHAEKAEEWHCGLCGENNHRSFEVCWRCQGLPPQTFHD